ncbi:hypothetical protein IAD21_00504 [Abditibacteriota bacterium]|nr:hypothetical protein IAD21_00504 [Abditibacteriota bacterium]
MRTLSVLSFARVGVSQQSASSSSRLPSLTGTLGQLVASSGLPARGRVALTGTLLLASVGLSAPAAHALSFATKIDYSTAPRPVLLVKGDFDGDGKTDLATANTRNNNLSVLLNNGNGTFKTNDDYSTGDTPVGVTVGDFNGDGKTDLATANYISSNVSVLLNNGDGTFDTNVDYDVGSSPQSVVTGDFDGDGKTDLATANQDSNSVSVLLGVGDGTFATKVDYDTGSLPYSVVTGDFNGDGKTDLAVANYDSSTVSVLLGSGTGTFATKVDYDTGSGPYNVVVGDFNGDGKTDLATANFNVDTVSVLSNNGDGTFGTHVDYDAGSLPQSVGVGDFDGDGKADLVTANQGGSNVSVLLGSGTGTFATPVNYDVGAEPGSGPASVVVGDFNGDGQADIADANNLDNSVSVLLNTTLSPPSVLVSLSSTSPKTNDTLTATTTPTNFTGTPTYFYEWKVGATIKQTGASNTFNLAVAGNGDRGDVITCTVTATSGAQSDTNSTTATIINSAPAINTTSLSSGAVNVAYGPVTLGATDADGDTPLTWTVSSGTLPAGITLSGTGVLSGTPTQGGTYTFTAQTSDGQGGTTTQALSLSIVSNLNVRISELRLSGPQGPLDEFVELYNSTNAPMDMSGWTLTAGSVFVSIPFGKTIPAYGHLLLTNSGTGPGDAYSLGTYAAGDVNYTGDIALNATVELKDAGGTLADSVSNLPGLFSPSSSTNQYSYMRRIESGTPAYTGTDSNDFNLVDISSGVSTVDGRGVGPMTGARLGAPGPQNLSSPVQRNLDIAITPINIPGNGLAGTAVTPEARYVSKNSTIDPKGRLSLRRSITNNTGTTVTSMRFRIVAITAGTSTTSGVADIRAISSGGVRYYASNGSTILQAAWPVVLEKPSSPTEAPLTAASGNTGKGGGLNSSWTVALPGGSLAPGASVGVEFLFGIVTDGNYRVVVDTELLP